MHCKIITKRFDYEDIYMGKIKAREYIKLEGELVDRLLSFFSYYNVMAMGFEAIAPIGGRYRNIYPPKAGFAIGAKDQKKLLKDILRKKYWMFICLSNRVGIHIEEDSDITLSNLNESDVNIIQKCNIKLEDASYLEVDNIYLCSNYMIK